MKPIKTYFKPSDSEIKSKLSPLAFEVTQRNATEPAFQNLYWDHHEKGIYVDTVTGEPLFSSLDKFNSGTGWPSFTKPIDEERVSLTPDSSYGMQRVEVRSRDGNSHLGHVFDDGPKPSGKRYCINSASLRFVPVNRLQEEGYKDYLSAFLNEKSSTLTDDKKEESDKNTCTSQQKNQKAGCNQTLEVAILAGGCFWGMEDILRTIPGVIDTEVGYTGGKSVRPTYDEVKHGGTGHAEAVRLLFDRTKLSYRSLLENWYFKMHDPTTKNRQGNDIGDSYRSAIFYLTEEQHKVAEEVKIKVDSSGKWKAPIVTEIVAAGEFTLAEDYHQDYLQKNPGGYTCHYMRE